MDMRNRVAAFLMLGLLAPLVTFMFAVPTEASSETPAGVAPTGSTRVTTTSGRIAPEPASALRAPAASAAQREAAAAAVSAQRERLAGEASKSSDSSAPAVAARPAVAVGPETQVDTQSETAQVTWNQQNTTASSVGNTLAEPAASNDGKNVFYSGNTYFSRSTNGGAGGWVQEGIPGGPADATVACCDPDAVYSPATDTTFNIMLYTNATQTNGVVRIWVRNGDLHSADCIYDIDPGGAADNLLPDYPHLAVSNGFLYLSSNNIVGGNWTGAQMRRFNITQMSACGSTSFNTFSYTGSVGQRIHTPVEGATTDMYWGQMDSTTTFRLFSWPESSASVTQTTQTVGASAFNNPDCRGGTGNFDFIERSTAWSIAGFRMRGATGGGRVTFLWPSSPVGSQTQAHLRGVSLNTSGFGVLEQPVVWNNGICISYPALSSNAFADLGLSLAAGGIAGGSGSAAQGYIAVDDSGSPGSIFFPSLVLTASGTHNRSDSRFGDYFTVRKNSRCTNSWVATNYALDGGTATSNVNARYIEFQTTDDGTCPSPK